MKKARPFGLAPSKGGRRTNRLHHSGCKLVCHELFFGYNHSLDGLNTELIAEWFQWRLEQKRTRQ